MTRRRPFRLALAAVLSGGALVTAGCVGDHGGSSDHQPPYQAPTRTSSVRAPTATDTVLGPAATPAPLSGLVRRPNLLMITLDDAAWGDMAYMPHLQQLMVHDGVTLQRGLAPTPMCAPARASLLTGQYAQNTGVTTINGEGGGFDAFKDDDNTLPVALQQAGYDTLFVGKYINGFTADHVGHRPPGWTDWRPTVDYSTYNFDDPSILVDGHVTETHTYSTTLLSQQSEQLLGSPEREKRPWFMWLNYVAPHHGGPIESDDPASVYPQDPSPIKTTVPEARDRNTFDHLPLPDKPNMFEKDTSDKEIIGATHDHVSAMRRAEMREAFEQRIEALQSVDRALARTFATLRSTGQLDDTYVVLTSDNGYVLGEHNLSGKLWYFREIVGVPMYVRGPGLPAGKVSQTPVSNADWAPTLAGLAGARMGRTVDGVDVMPWITADAPKRVVPIEGWPVNGGPKSRYQGVDVGPWTYVENHRGQSELYYRTVDPYELDNLATDPRYRKQLHALRRLTHEYIGCAGTACPQQFYR